MSSATENDLKELKDLINQRFNQLNERITELRINQEKIQTRLDDWKPSIDKTADLSEKIGELKKRCDPASASDARECAPRHWRQIGLILITGIITSLFWTFKDRI